jgi:hypothetical protein
MDIYDIYDFVSTFDLAYLWNDVGTTRQDKGLWPLLLLRYQRSRLQCCMEATSVVQIATRLLLL